MGAPYFTWTRFILDGGKLKLHRDRYDCEIPISKA